MRKILLKVELLWRSMEDEDRIVVMRSYFDDQLNRFRDGLSVGF